VPQSVSDKQRIAKAVLESWPETDQTVFQAYVFNCRHEMRYKLLSECPNLFEFCQFNKEEELAKIKLYGLSSDLPNIPQIGEL
jgi:hypothetical protein